MSQTIPPSVWKGIFLFFMAFSQFSFAQTGKINILVFSKTAAFRHESIGAGKVALDKMAKEKGFTATFTEESSLFNERELAKYSAVVFLNTTGDVLNNEQQTSFERYIQGGGGYVGIHSATDCEYDWAWYGQLAGAYFLDHPSTPSNVQKGKFMVTQKNHFLTQGMADEFEKTDEFYSFKNISPQINVVLKIDEKSYIGGHNGDNHPMSWYQEFNGGRSFYTAMGHTNETFSEPLFLNHLYAGIKYAAGGDAPKPIDYSKSRPEENRFSKVVLLEKLDEPIELSLLDPERVLFVQRHGAVRLYNTKTKEVKTIATIPVSHKYVSKEGKESEAEDGLMGLNKDPNFAQNHWIYMYYSSTKGSYNQLSRFTMKGDELDLSSEKEMLRVETQREECCHTGGSIAWDKNGNLYLSTGDNTNPHGSSGYSPSDERPGREAWDAQKSSANTNDLRGKIIRIKPNTEGGYSIPEGNLFPQGTAKTRPEIYTMGHRNPYRISVDPKTGYLYWGEVGPDGQKPDPSRGPAGHDEVGQARKAGNFGWPHFVGDNKAYNKYDFAASKSLKKWQAEKPINTSPNNTGLVELPPAQNAFIWYPYAESPEFPLVGSGGRNAMAGPVFYSEDFKNAERAFPKYYDGKFLAYEWMRGWIMAVTMDAAGNLQSMERFMPSYKFSNPMDMEFAANGDLYMLEYGSGWFTQNDDARLIRIEYNGGNRKPQIEMSANQLGGAIPFNVNLTSKGTKDADGDALKYEWTVVSKDKKFKKTIKQADATVFLKKVGVYQATLTVNDGKGGVSTQSMEISAGNEPPVLSFDMPKSNKTFYFANKSFDYEVKVQDKEDGSLADGRITPEQVSVKIDYLPEGYDKIEIAQGHRSADTKIKGLKLISASDCAACHKKDSKSIGPAYVEIAKKYKGSKTALETLTKKIIAGGGGIWGEVPMAGHPQLSTEDAAEMTRYILSLSDAPADKSLPVKGSFTTKTTAKDKGYGTYILRAAYEDQGANGVPALTSEQTYTLRNAKLHPHSFDKYDEINKMSFGGNALCIPSKSGSYMALNKVDLMSIAYLDIVAATPVAQLNAAGGKIEVRLGSPTGKLIGESPFLEPSDAGGFGGKPTRITLVPTEGAHDVYVVFVNPKSEGRSLMVVMAIEFKQVETAQTAAPVVETKTNIEEYVGKYKMTGLPFDYVEITVQDGKVIMNAGGQGGPVSPTDTPDKYDADGKAILNFIRNDAKKVTGVQMEAMGFKFEGKKE